MLIDCAARNCCVTQNRPYRAACWM